MASRSPSSVSSWPSSSSTCSRRYAASGGPQLVGLLQRPLRERVDFVDHIVGERRGVDPALFRVLLDVIIGFLHWGRLSVAVTCDDLISPGCGFATLPRRAALHAR